MTNLTAIISAIAVLVSCGGVYFSFRFSRITILNNVQTMMLEKARECNVLWKKGVWDHMSPNNTGDVFVSAVREVFTSLELMDNCLDHYKLRGKREFLVEQFWAQLHYDLRVFLKDDRSQDRLKIMSGQIINFQQKYYYLKPVLF